MSDDPPRPASGQQSDPRPAAGAPAWWAALGRPDLPLGADAEPAPPRLAPAESTPAPVPHRAHLTRWRAWAFNGMVLVIAVLIICVGVGVVSLSTFLTAALIFGVPLAVAAGTATVVARRSR